MINTLTTTAILDETLTVLCRNVQQFYNKINSYRIDLHLKRRFEERYNIAYSKEIESEIRKSYSKLHNRQQYKVCKTSGSKLFKVKYKDIYVYPVVCKRKDFKKLCTYLSEDQYRSK